MWNYSIQYGPEGEAIYAWVYFNNELVATMKIQYAMQIVEAMNSR